MFYDVYSKLCAENGVSVSKMAESIGLNRSAVVKWKKGAVPNGPTLQKLAEKFGVSADYLLGTETKKAPTLDDERSPDNFVNGDQELTEVLEQLRNRSEMRMLFSVSKNASKEDVEKAVAIIEALRNVEGRG